MHVSSAGKGHRAVDCCSKVPAKRGDRQSTGRPTKTTPCPRELAMAFEETVQLLQARGSEGCVPAPTNDDFEAAESDYENDPSNAANMTNWSFYAVMLLCIKQQTVYRVILSKFGSVTQTIIIIFAPSYFIRIYKSHLQSIYS